MGDPEARPALATDAEQCAEICREAVEALASERGGPLAAAQELSLVIKAISRPGGLARLLADPRRKVLVVAMDDSLVGMCIGRMEVLGAAKLGVVEWGYVRREARGKGAGAAMRNLLTAWFEEAGAAGIDATVLPGDRETKVFLEEAGFKARLITVHHSLG